MLRLGQEFDDERLSLGMRLSSEGRTTRSEELRARGRCSRREFIKEGQTEVDLYLLQVYILCEMQPRTAICNM